MIDYTGKKYGLLTVIGLDYYVQRYHKNGTKNGKKYYWKCMCSCGNTNVIVVPTSNLTTGNTHGCGCTRIEKVIKANKEKVKLNKYEFYNDYVVGYTNNSNDKFYFDLEDYDKIKNMSWYIDNNGYVINRTDWKLTSLHRFVLNASKGRLVDHADRNPLNNRKINLRECDYQENARNQRLKDNCTSGFTGVTYRDSKKEIRWKAKIRYENKNVTLGTFGNKDDAIKARLQAEKEHYGDFAPQRHLFAEYGI